MTENAEDLSALAGHVTALVSAGMPIPQWWVREKFGIPEPEKDEPILQPAQSAAPFAAMRANGCGCATRRGKKSFAPACTCAHAQTEPQTEDLQTAQLETETAAAWQAVFERIRALVEQADTLEGLQAALLMEYGNLPTDELAEIMATAFAAADLAGRYEVMESGRD